MNAKVHPSLKAMAEDKDVNGVSKVTSFNVDPRLVEFEEGFNGRPINREHVDFLKAAKLGGGEWPDIIVRVDAGRIFCVDGHHRITAVCELLNEGEDVAPVLGAKQFRGNADDRQFLMLDSQEGLKLTALQLAEQYKKLVGRGWTPTQIADRRKKSVTHVTDTLALCEANSDVRAMVENGTVPAKIARQAVRAHGSNAGEVLAGHLQTAKANGKSKVTERVINPRQVTLEDAIRQEIKSNGLLKAQDIAPQYADLIDYLRKSGV